MAPKDDAPRTLVRRAQHRELDQAAAKAKVIDLIGKGAKINEAMKQVQRTFATYRDWYSHDADFSKEIKYLRALAERTAKERKGDAGHPVPDFPEFAAMYLHQPLYEHHLRIYDILSGREPRNLHESMVYRPGRPARLLVNVPPDHGKTVGFSINWVTWLIHRNPDIKVVIVSKTQGMARKMLGAIRFRLTDPSYRAMHLAFAPNGGWKDEDASWTQSEIYVKGRGTGEKDPTVQALGIGGHLQGARSDIIILDDVVDRGNAGAWENQADWLAQIVTSRLPDDDEDIPMQSDAPGKLLIVGTRNAPVELYQVLRDDYTDMDGDPVYTYLAQPAVLEPAENPQDWVTLWPYTIDAKGNRRRKWDGRALAKRRGDVRSEALWALTFQQQDVAENATFPAEAIAASVNSGRRTGLLHKEGPGAVRGDRGMQGMYVVAGLDPATVGHTAMIVYGIDRLTRRRYVLDAVNQAAMSPHEMRGHIKRLTTHYTIREWVVERNSFQAFLTQDQELRMWLANAGCHLREHYTTAKNKWDPDFGVSSLAPLFLSCVSEVEGGRLVKVKEGGLVELPSSHQCQAISDLITQLVTWVPQAKGTKTDLVMALWFAEVGAREYIGVNAHQVHHLPNPYASRFDLGRREVVDLNALAEQMWAEQAGASTW